MRRRRAGGGRGWRRGPGAWSWGGSLDGGELVGVCPGGGVGDGLEMGGERGDVQVGAGEIDPPRAPGERRWVIHVERTDDLPAWVSIAVRQAAAVVGGHRSSRWSWWVAGQMGAEV